MKENPTRPVWLSITYLFFATHFIVALLFFGAALLHLFMPIDHYVEDQINGWAATGYKAFLVGVFGLILCKIADRIMVQS